MDLLDELESRILPGDGAMVPLLMEKGVPVEGCFEELCVSAPDRVRDVHEQYISAGARVIRTNSFGANAVRLAKYGLEKHVNQINWSAAQIAKECARGKSVHIGGSVGPLGITAVEARDQGINRESIFREQIGALLDGGVNLIFLETFTDLDELLLALYVKQSLHHHPAVCSLSCGEEGRLPSGITLLEAFAELRAHDADIIGINCLNGPDAVHLFEELPAEGLLSAYPNAGMAENHDERYIYDASPDNFAILARRLAEEGGRLIGGCCGIGPQHVEAMTAALGELKPCTSKTL